jgi:hypothetical protein
MQIWDNDAPVVLQQYIVPLSRYHCSSIKESMRVAYSIQKYYQHTFLVANQVFPTDLWVAGTGTDYKRGTVFGRQTRYMVQRS